MALKPPNSVHMWRESQAACTVRPAVEAGTNLLRFPDDSGRSLAQFCSECPAGTQIDLAPGRYEGGLRIDRRLSLRGAGDLTRITGVEGQAVITVLDGGDLELSAVSLEDASAPTGAGIDVQGGFVRLLRVHVQRTRSDSAGGALAVRAGKVWGELLRVEEVATQGKGGAIWVGEGQLELENLEIVGATADQGGALALENGARVVLRGATISRTRAERAGAGEFLWRQGSPEVQLVRVKVDGSFLDPVGGDLDGALTMSGCDLPRRLREIPGAVDAGENLWR